jgi:Arc/MetJ-type ribon-helix-helix transcriptional regulator
MKISVSLPEADVRFLDEYGERTGAGSRSSVLHAAIELLRDARLEEDYAAAWREWDEGEDAQLWESTVADGLADAAR